MFIDLLSDAGLLRRLGDGRRLRVIGRAFLQSAAGTLQWVPDRTGYAVRQLWGESRHTAIIRHLANHLLNAPDSTLAEIDYVIRNCELIGQQIDLGAERMSGSLYSMEGR